MWANVTKEIIQRDRESLLANSWPLYTLAKVLEFNNVVTDDTIICVKSPAAQGYKKLKQLDVLEKPYYNIMHGDRHNPQKIDIIQLLFDVVGAKNNTVVAGGFIHDFCVNKHMRLVPETFESRKVKTNDIDVFFWSDKPNEDVWSVSNTMTKQIAALDDLKKFGFETNHSRNSHVYNVNIFRTDRRADSITIQFVTKIFTNKSSIIGKFDINSSAIMYDGNAIQFTELSAYSYGTLHNYVDPLRKSATYEYRMNKYTNVKMGFSIAFPEAFSVPIDGKVESNYSAMYKNIKEFRQFDKTQNEDISIYGWFISAGTMVHLYNTNKYNKIYFNIDKNSGITYVDSNKIRQFYRYKTPSLYNGTIEQLSKIYPIKVFEEMMHAYIQNKYNINVTSDATIRDNYVNQLIKTLDIYVYEKYNTNNRLSIDWNISGENPLGPEPMDPKEWYGDWYFKKP